MTRAEIFAAVRLMSRRPRTADTDLALYMKLTESRLNTLLREHPRNEVIAVHTQTADAYTDEYSPLVPIPSDMAGLITLAQNGTIYPQYPAGQPNDTPALGFIQRGKCFEVFPAPGVDTEYTITYHSFLLPLDSEWSTNWVSEWFSDAYVYGMLAELGSSVVHDRRKEWAQQFAAIVDGISKQGWNQNFAATMKVRTYG